MTPPPSQSEMLLRLFKPIGLASAIIALQRSRCRVWQVGFLNVGSVVSLRAGYLHFPSPPAIAAEKDHHQLGTMFPSVCPWIFLIAGLPATSFPCLPSMPSTVATPQVIQVHTALFSPKPQVNSCKGKPYARVLYIYKVLKGRKREGERNFPCPWMGRDPHAFLMTSPFLAVFRWFLPFLNSINFRVHCNILYTFHHNAIT